MTDAQTRCAHDENGICLHCGHKARSRPHYRICPKFFKHAVPRVESWAVNGPGTELSKLLKRFGIEPTPTCSCRAKAAEMDAWGCDECSRPERIDEVVAVMREEAAARGLPFIDAVGRLLVKRAIANARKAAAGS